MKRIVSILLCLVVLALPPAAPAFAKAGELSSADIAADGVESFSGGYAPYYSNGLYGVVRYDGRVVIEPKYQDIADQGEQLWPVQTEHGWQFVNIDGTTAIAGPFESAEPFIYGVSVVSVGGLYGAISPSGAFVIEPSWELINSFTDMGCAAASQGGRWTLIDPSGARLTERDYDAITTYDGAMIGKRGGTYDVLLPDGSVAQTFAADELGGCAQGYITYRTGDVWQLRKLDGSPIWQLKVPEGVEYMSMMPPIDGYVLCALDEGGMLYDLERGAWLGDGSWADAAMPSGGFIRVKFTDGMQGYCDMNGMPTSDKSWVSASDFHYGLAVVQDEQGAWYVIDEEFERVSDLEGELVSEFAEIGFEHGYVVCDTESGVRMVRVSGSEVEGGEFVIEDGTLKAYRGEGGEVRIPLGVTAIAEGALRGNEDITALVLPATLKSIGAQAFAECANLRGVVNIPASVTEIGERAFAYSPIEAFEVAADNPVYLSWEGGLATLDGVFMVYPMGSDAQYYSLPYNARELADYSFAGCNALRYLNVPYSAADKLDISSRAFRDNDSTYVICNRDTHAANEALKRELPLLTVYTTPEPTEAPTVMPTETPVATVMPTEAPTPSPTPAPTGVPGKTMVYFNVNGKYYHSVSDCSGMKNAGYYTLDEAIAQGKQRCDVCAAPQPSEAPTDMAEATAQAQPTVIPTEAPSAQPGETVVYFTDNGTYYHSVSDCSGMKNAKEHTLDEAAAYGKQRCEVCAPPEVQAQPTVMPTEAPTAQNGETVVYFTENGTYYHAVSDCSGMKNAAEHTLKEAAEQGKQRCEVCAPPAIDAEAAPEITAQPTAMPEATEQSTVIPEATDEPTALPESTEQPTVIPEATAMPEATEQPAGGVQPEAYQPAMFCAKDSFIGMLTPGLTTRAELEQAMGEQAVNESAAFDEMAQQDVTVVEYAFGEASFDANGVLVRAHIDGESELSIARELNISATLDDVLDAFYYPEQWFDVDADILYSEQGYTSYMVINENDGGMTLTYEYPLEDGRSVYLCFEFWVDRMTGASMGVSAAEVMNS